MCEGIAKFGISGIAPAANYAPCAAFNANRSSLGATCSCNNSSGNGGVTNLVYGNAAYMSGSTHGGHNVLTGGNDSGASVQNQLYGDAAGMSDSAQGGHNILIGGSNTGGVGVLNLLSSRVFSIAITA
jgi:hypothetical protein